MPENNLAYTTPESLGIPSEAVESFLEVLEKNSLCMHGFMLMRRGRVAAEGYWRPFEVDRLHRIYSISKSFTAVAVGMMVEEGKISLDSRPADIFPEYLPESPHPYVMEATVRDLLIMATYNLGTSYTPQSPDFAETFFTDSRHKHKPGQIFSYDTAATTVLCAIIEKLSGKPILEYMCPVLDEIGFSKDAWCVQTPEGRSWTGSGISCTMRDLARFALLCMNQGAWNGKQLVDSGYMRAATSRQISTANADGWPGGYGYQFWCMPGGGFAMIGMGGQLALCMPKYDAILITTADIQGRQDAMGIILNAFDSLLESFVPETLPENAKAQEKLRQRVAGLSIPLPQGELSTPLAGKISGQKYVLEENSAGIKWLCLLIEPDKCRLQYEKADGNVNELVFGMGKYEHQLFPEKYFGKRIGVRDTRYKCIGAAAWTDENALVCTLYSIDDHLGSIKLQLTFDDDDVCGFMKKAAEWFFEDYQGFISGKKSNGV